MQVEIVEAKEDTIPMSETRPGWVVFYTIANHRGYAIVLPRNTDARGTVFLPATNTTEVWHGGFPVRPVKARLIIEDREER